MKTTHTPKNWLLKLNKINRILEKLDDRRHADFQRVTRLNRPMKFKLTYDRIKEFEAIKGAI